VIQGVEVDEQGNEIGPASTVNDPTRRQEEEHFLRKAREEGRSGLIERHTKGLAEARKDEQAERTASAQEKANALREADLARKAQADANRHEESMKRLQAMENRIAKGQGSREDTARMREVNFVADVMFEGDKKKAAAYVFGSADRQGSYSEVANVAKILREEGFEGDATAEAEKRIEAWRARNSGSRGGIQPSKPDAKPADKPKVDAKPAVPKSKTEYEALPSGALYIHPKDGKTYRKP